MHGEYSYDTFRIAEVNLDSNRDHSFLSSSFHFSCMYVCTAYYSMEDANFDRSVANQAVTYLHNEEEWARLILADELEGNLREGDYNFMDRVFDNEM